jgi:hypothetical protein
MEPYILNIFGQAFLAATPTPKIFRFLDELNTRGVLWGRAVGAMLI